MSLARCVLLVSALALGPGLAWGAPGPLLAPMDDGLGGGGGGGEVGPVKSADLTEALRRSDPNVVKEWLRRGTPLVLKGTSSGEPILIEADRASLETLFRSVGVPELSPRAADIASANSALFALVRVGAARYPSSAERQAASDVYQSTGAALLLEAMIRLPHDSKGATPLELKLRRLADEELSPKDRAAAENLVNLALQFWKRSETVDEAGRDDGLQDLRLLDALNEARQVVVAIAESLPDGELSFRGTGFLRNGKIVTCAHVVAQVYGSSKFDPDLTRLRIVTSDSGRFDKSSPRIKLDAGCSEGVRSQSDVAILAIAKQQPPPASAWLARAAEAEKRLYRIEDPVNEGSLILFGVVCNGGTAELKFSVPGRVAFPELAELPDVEEPGKPFGPARFTSEGDDYFWRAVRVQVASSLTMGMVPGDPRTVGSAVLEAIREVIKRYSGQGTADDSRKFFVYPSSRSYRDRFKVDALRCAGTDMPSRDGNSGGPVFLLKDSVAYLAGMHAGLAERDRRRGDPVSLDNFTRVISATQFDK